MIKHKKKHFSMMEEDANKNNPPSPGVSARLNSRVAGSGAEASVHGLELQALPGQAHGGVSRLTFSQNLELASAPPPPE